MIQYRLLNRSKGPAMWSPRAQCDRAVFTLEWRNVLEDIPHLEFWQDKVTSLIIEDAEVKGVITLMGIKFRSKKVILTAGTFINGLELVGIAWSDNPDVIITNRTVNRTFFLNRGSMFMEATVKDVKKDSVIIEYEGEEIELK